MMTLDKDVVVRQRRSKQILAYDRRRLNPNLRAAEVLLVLAACYSYIYRQQTLHVVRQLDERVLARLQFAVDSNADTRLKLRGELMFRGHLQRNGTLGKQNLASLRDACGVGHKARFARQFLADHEGDERRNIAFASSRNTEVIQLADSDTTCVLNGFE